MHTLPVKISAPKTLDFVLSSVVCGRVLSTCGGCKLRCGFLCVFVCTFGGFVFNVGRRLYFCHMRSALWLFVSPTTIENCALFCVRLRSARYTAFGMLHCCVRDPFAECELRCRCRPPDIMECGGSIMVWRRWWT